MIFNRNNTGEKERIKREKTENNILYIIKKTIKYNPLYVMVIMSQYIINAFIPSLQIIIIANFINAALNIANLGSDIRTIYRPIIGIILTLGFTMISDKLIYFVRIKLMNKVRIELNGDLIEKYAKLSYKHLEDPGTLDIIERMLKEPEIQLIDAYSNIIACISLMVTISSIVAVIISQVLWAGILILLCAIPLLYFSIKSGKANYEMNKETTKYVRKYNYIGELLTGRDAIDERTLFGFSKELNEKWVESYEKARKMIFHTELKWWFKMKLGGLLTVIISLIITLALLPPVMSGVITIGMFMSLINSTHSLVNRMCNDLTDTMDKLARNAGYVNDMKAFYALSETPGATDLPLKCEFVFNRLEFKNVKFKYPKTEKYILDGLSFVIEKGRHYSFVGLNGSGKTTITKLISGLYQDFEGEILINNKSILEYEQSQIKSMCSIAFQDFAKYALSVKENLLIGNVNKRSENGNEIEKAISLVGLDDMLKKLPLGLDTKLGKVKSDGIDLSGGEWQRVALARFILNKGPLKILDEPTSALDPINESKMYEKFDMICKSQTAIFISHRLGSTKIADEIFVIGDGKIKEFGSHKELMDLKGLYSELYESQRSWYR